MSDGPILFFLVSPRSEYKGEGEGRGKGGLVEVGCIRKTRGAPARVWLRKNICYDIDEEWCRHRRPSHGQRYLQLAILAKRGGEFAPEGLSVSFSVSISINLGDIAEGKNEV